MKVNIVKFDWETETPTEICLTNIIELIIGGVNFRPNHNNQKVYFCYNIPKNHDPQNAYITTKELERVKKLLVEFLSKEVL